MAPTYVPALKAREAEAKALLKAPRSLDIVPLFELQAVGPSQVDPATGFPKRAKSSITDASYFVDDIARLWNAPSYIDISRVAVVPKRAAWWSLIASLNTLSPSPLSLIPVLLPSDGPAEYQSAAQLARVAQRAAVRIDMVTARGNLARLSTAVQSAASGVLLSAGDIDVILDWGDMLETVALDQLEAETVAAIGAIGSSVGRVVTLGTPNSSPFVQDGDWAVARREWWLWTRLVASGKDVTFGDYALYPPAPPAPAPPRYGHLRYSSGDQLHVHRRPIPASGGGLGGAFAECCKHLVAQPHWLGAAFSGADQRIADIAANADKESLAGKWRQLASEHHFAVVADQLSRPASPPPPGTP